ncbi:hypothetical protein Btru_020400 [Bulinus truncatus]|nr:hypothetical protein Btru_020400 [Bulinus truncatus]
MTFISTIAVFCKGKMAILPLLVVLVSLSRTGGDPTSKSCNAQFFIKTFSDGTSSCLYIAQKRLLFTQAVNACSSMSSHLITPKTIAQFNYLPELKLNFWVGLDDIQNEAVFRWHDDNSTFMDGLLGQNFWLKGQPDDRRQNEDCVEYYWDVKGLNDYDCYSLNYYICESPISSLGILRLPML